MPKGAWLEDLTWPEAKDWIDRGDSPLLARTAFSMEYVPALGATGAAASPPSAAICHSSYRPK